MKYQLHIYIDGACHGNPGEGAIGVVLNRERKKIKEISQAIGEVTNNIAEYTALIYALQEALIQKANEILVHTDSELLFHQVTGKYKIKNPKLLLLFDQVQHLSRGFKKVEFKLIPREINKDADKLANQALEKKQAKMVAPLFTNSGEESPNSEG